MKKLFNRRNIIFLTFFLLTVSLVLFFYFLNRETEVKEITKANSSKIVNKPDSAPTPTPTSTITPLTPTPTVSSWPVYLNSEQAASLTVVVNKKHKLPADYVPQGGGLRTEAQTAFNQLVSAAAEKGHSLKLLSGYRSYVTQESTYNGWVNLYGQAYADTISARAGFSEHQTGLAIDIGDVNNSGCDLEICFGETEAGKWLAANAASYGFVLRYQNGKESITGYSYEPWHFRFVGVEVAIKVADSGLTLDEYFGVEGSDYQ